MSGNFCLGILAVGDSSEYHNRAEFYRYDTESWQRVADYPFYSEISMAPVIAYGGGFVIFGGYVKNNGFFTETNLIGKVIPF